MRGLEKLRVGFVNPTKAACAETAHGCLENSPTGAWHQPNGSFSIPHWTDRLPPTAAANGPRCHRVHRTGWMWRSVATAVVRWSPLAVAFSHRVLEAMSLGHRRRVLIACRR